MEFGGFYTRVELEEGKETKVFVNDELVGVFPVNGKVDRENSMDEHAIVDEERGYGYATEVIVGKTKIDVEYYPDEEHWQVLINGTIVEEKETA